MEEELASYDKFFEEVVKDQDEFENEYDAGLSETILFVMAWTAYLELRKGSESYDGNRVSKNLTKLYLFREALRRYLNGSKVASSIYGIISKLDIYTTKIDTYIGKISAKNVMDKEVLRQMIELTKVNLRTQLLQSGIDAYLVGPVMANLQTAIVGDVGRDKLVEIVRQVLTPKARLNRWVKQTTNDALNGFIAEYQRTQAKQVGLSHYLYDGVRVKDSRAFCVAKKGRVFTEKEVESWVSGNWEGKIPTTTAQSIFVYRGGYGCIDHLRPIPEKLYQILKERENG